MTDGTQSGTRTNPEAGLADISGMDDVTGALRGLVQDLQSFKKSIEDSMNMHTTIDTKAAIGRPPLSAAVAEAPHLKALDGYLRQGDDDALRALGAETKGLSTLISAEGGFLLDPQTAETVAGVLRSTVSLRSIAQVVTVEAGTFDVLVDHADFGAGWATETGTVGETDASRFDRISISLHELSALPKASQRLLDDAAFDVEAWLAQRIADRFARAEGEAFVTGDGVDKPRGFLTHTAVAQDAWSWGTLGYVTTGIDGDFAETAPAASIVDLVYALGARYRANATFVMNSRTAGAVRKMKDADGRFLWSDSLQAGEPPLLMGYPVLVAEDMPDIASGSYAIAFGDFGTGYTIAERPDLRVLRDPFSAKPHVLFYATKRVGGDVTDFAAIKLLKFATG